MFLPVKCITIYCIILLHVATSAFGMTFHGDWLAKNNPETKKANTLLHGACQRVLEEATKNLNEGVKITPPLTVVSMVYFEQQGNDKPKHTGVVALQNSYEPNAGQHPGGNQDEDEGNFFTIVLNYLNLEGDDVNDEDRLVIANEATQDHAVTTSLKLAQEGVKALVEASGNIKMARPILRGVKKTWKRCCRAVSKVVSSISEEVSGSAN